MAAERRTRATTKPVVEVERPPFECIALLLQGGGALGAYQCGVYQALAEVGIHPDWVAGISIGAMNAAIIAGNRPEERVDKLRGFWEEITTTPWSAFHQLAGEMVRGAEARKRFNQAASAWALAHGAKGFFMPRMPIPWLHPAGTVEATSWYDTGALRSLLERFVDFDRLNSGETRISVGAVQVRSGNFVFFDSKRDRILPQHIMASGALPPGFPAVEIDGEPYWDGGLISNTPLQYVVAAEPNIDMLAFQVDLWSARGEIPSDLAEVSTRQKEIQYSSRTRANTDNFKRIQKMKSALNEFLNQIPDEFKTGKDYDTLKSAACCNVYNIVHLIYRSRNYEGDSKDYDFSRLSMEDHWRSGYHDAVRTLRHPEILRRPSHAEAVRTFDLT